LIVVRWNLYVPEAAIGLSRYTPKRRREPQDKRLVLFAPLVCARWFFVDLANGATPFWRNLYYVWGTIQRWCDRIRDDFIGLGSAGVPDQSQEAKRCCILRLKSKPRRVKGDSKPRV
jgi:hypothetical protein